MALPMRVFPVSSKAWNAGLYVTSGSVEQPGRKIAPEINRKRNQSVTGWNELVA